MSTIKSVILATFCSDDVDQFRLLLQSETQQWQWPSESDISDYELLMKAVKFKCKRIVNLLLEKGARVFKNGALNSPLHQAVQYSGWTEIIEKLLAHGASVSVQNCRGDSPLHKAFRCHASQAVMNMLLRAYIDDISINQKSGDGLSFLHIVSSSAESEILQEYLANFSTDINTEVSRNASEYSGYTALHFAVLHDKFDNIKILLENGANIYYADTSGSTPLHLALERQNLKMIDLLFTYDSINYNAVSNKGLSHFMAACAASDSEVVEQFLNIAEGRGCRSRVNLIRSRVADDNASYSFSGYTPLHFAAEFGQLENVEKLIIVGGDPSALTSSNSSPFMLALRQRHYNVCRLIHSLWELSVQNTQEKLQRLENDINDLLDED